MRKNSSNVHRMYKRPPKVMFSSNSVADFRGMYDLLPRPLYILLNMYGLTIKRESRVPLDKNCCQKTFSLTSLKILLPYISLLFYFVGNILSPYHTTFIIGGMLDYGTYLIAFHLFLQRRKKLINCIRNLLQICQESNSLISCKYNMIFILIAITSLYSVAYFVFGAVYTCSKLKLHSNSDILKYIQLIVNWMTYSLFINLGIPLHVLLFVYVSILMSNTLSHITKHIDEAAERKALSADSIPQQRIIFCKLQNISSEADSIFNEAIFLWLLKIIVRTCLGTVDILTRSWTNNEFLSQFIVVFDCVLDFSQLLILFHFGGRIVIAKKNIMNSLIFINGIYSDSKHELRKELHHFITLLGNSNIEFTVGNIFPLDRKISFSIFGVLASYAILIYQLTLD